jgi:hypothetical protein
MLFFHKSFFYDAVGNMTTLRVVVLKRATLAKPAEQKFV